MKQFFMPSAGSPLMDWLVFIAILLPVCLAIIGFIVWLQMFRHPDKKSRPKRRKHRHHRHHNPTLDQAGGLPPMREPDQPPPGL
jgi:hypothetical protein